MAKRLENKIALVTGGSRGIGAAIVRRLAAEGAAVAFTYGKSATEAEKLAKEIAASGGKGKSYAADALQPEKMPELAAEVLADFGKIDILVNNAGVGEGGMIGQTDYETYRRVMTVNVDAVFALTNAVVPHLKAGARIINIGSILGERGIFGGMSIYNASKFAVAGLTRSWAHDLGGKGILVNAVQPGPIDTDMNPDNGSQESEMQKAMTPLHRYGKPEEIAAAVAFLAGPDATFMTGARLTVDGGLNA